MFCFVTMFMEGWLFILIIIIIIFIFSFKKHSSELLEDIDS